MRIQLIASVLLVSVLSTPEANAQIASTNTYAAEELQRHFRNVAADYRIVLNGKELQLQKQPLLHWNNPARLQEQGALFVWNQNGRPHALCSIFTYGTDEGTFCRHECISLSDASLTASLNSQVVWSPTKPGLTWNAVQLPQAPGSTPSRRLIQFRTIARTFSGTLFAPGAPARLNLIPQPLLRYSAPEEGIVDGAIFSMAVATDPELFLVIEAIETDGEQSWRYSAARSHFWTLELKKDQEKVWRADDAAELLSTKAGQLPWMNDPYFIFFESQALPLPETLR